MKAFVCFTLALLVAFTAFGHMTPDGWNHLADADRKPHHGTKHWHISSDLQLETAWSHCVEVPGVYDESTGEYDFRPCDRLPDPVEPDPETPNIAPVQPVALQPYIPSFPPPPPPPPPAPEEPTRYSISIVFHSSAKSKSHIGVEVKDQNGNAIKDQVVKISISPTRQLTDRVETYRSNDGSLSGKTGTGENKPPGIFIVNVAKGATNSTYTVTVSMTRDEQVWSRTLSYIEGTSVGSSNDLIEPTPKTSLQRFEPVEIIYLEATEPKPAPQQQERIPVERAPVPKGAEVAPTGESTEPQLALGDGKESVPYTPTYIQQLSEESNNKMTFPQGVNSLHLPFKPRKSFFFTDLVNLLGDVNVNSISALRPTVQARTIITSSHSVHNEWISPQRGFVADMKNTVTVDLVREPDGGGGGTI